MPGEIAVVIPARDEADRIADTVRAAVGLPSVDIVLVVDDGSADRTAALAEQAGALVIRHGRGRGKAAAMQTGAEAIRLLEERGAVTTEPARPDGAAQGTAKKAARHLLFLDADLGSTAANTGPLTDPVREGKADMTIAVIKNRVKLGGHGIVVKTAGAGIQRATGWRPVQPLNGQRCLTRAAFQAALPLAHGWGAETGLTIDLMRKGMRITEVEVDIAHRATGTDLRSQLHRAHQLTDVARALARRWL